MAFGYKSTWVTEVTSEYQDDAHLSPFWPLPGVGRGGDGKPLPESLQGRPSLGHPAPSSPFRPLPSHTSRTSPYGPKRSNVSPHLVFPANAADKDLDKTASIHLCAMTTTKFRHWKINKTTAPPECCTLLLNSPLLHMQC